MAHTNQTAHYHLPQYVGTDIINPLTDTNKAYEDIDTALYEQGQSVAGVVDDIDALKIQNGDSALDTTAQTLSGAVNELKSGADALGLRVTANETDISTLQTQMSTATGNITTLNTSVAGLQTEVGGLQTEVASKASATALNNLTTKVGTGNLDTVAQNCIDAINEINAKIPSGGNVEADDVVYDNTSSGLTATNVQNAIDEINDKIPVIELTHTVITGTTPASASGTITHAYPTGYDRAHTIVGTLMIETADGTHDLEIDISNLAVSLYDDSIHIDAGSNYPSGYVSRPYKLILFHY